MEIYPHFITPFLTWYQSDWSSVRILPAPTLLIVIFVINGERFFFSFTSSSLPLLRIIFFVISKIWHLGAHFEVFHWLFTSGSLVLSPLRSGKSAPPLSLPSPAARISFFSCWNQVFCRHWNQVFCWRRISFSTAGIKFFSCWSPRLWSQAHLLSPCSSTAGIRFNNRWNCVFRLLEKSLLFFRLFQPSMARPKPGSAITVLHRPVELLSYCSCCHLALTGAAALWRS